MQRTPRIQTFIPTMTDAKDKTDEFYSSYLPVVATYSRDQQSENAVSVLVYRVLDQHAQNAVRDNSDDPDNEKLRYWRITHALKKIDYMQGLDVIALQDVDVVLMRRYVAQILGSDWKCEPIDKSKIDNNKLLTIYNTKRQTLIGESKYDNDKRILKSRFRRTNGAFEFDFHNVWSKPCDKQEDLEADYRGLLAKASGCAIIAAETGAYIASAGINEPRNLTTGVATPDKKLQVPLYSYGVFVKTPEGRVDELVVTPVDVKTGATALDARSVDDIMVELPELQLKACQKHHSTLALASYYEGAALINGETIFQCENRMRSLTNDNSVLIRPACNAFNSRSFSVRLEIINKKSHAEIDNALLSLMPEHSFECEIIVNDKNQDKGMSSGKNKIAYQNYFIKKEYINDFIIAMEFIYDIKNKLDAIADTKLDAKAKEAIENAKKDYVEIDGKKGFGREKSAGDKIWSMGASLNAFVFRPATRKEVIEQRIQQAQNDGEFNTSYITLQRLLASEKDAQLKPYGSGIRSFRGLLASYLVGKQANTPEEVSVMIRMADVQLQTKVLLMEEEWEREMLLVERNARK